MTYLSVLRNKPLTHGDGQNKKKRVAPLEKESLKFYRDNFKISDCILNKNIYLLCICPISFG